MTTVDWTEQMEAVTKQWTDTQRQLWSSWSAAAQQATTTAQTKAAWQQMVDLWKNSVHRMLEMQVDTARLWSESVAESDALEGVAQWAEQSYEMTKQWSAMQKQLWDGWFQILEKMEPTHFSNVMGSNPIGSSKDLNSQPMMKLWSDMMQQAGSMQQEWVKSWTSWPSSK